MLFTYTLKDQRHIKKKLELVATNIKNDKLTTY